MLINSVLSLISLQQQLNMLLTVNHCFSSVAAIWEFPTIFVLFSINMNHSNKTHVRSVIFQHMISWCSAEGSPVGGRTFTLTHVVPKASASLFHSLCSHSFSIKGQYLLP